ncbi:hypothetical protein DFP73DRAFT_535856 [Morchella snyderi]|nr:hypothetical protein DFP73DRAFT_535856 [Morchella snyderi]
MTKITTSLSILFLCLLSLSSFSITAAQTDTTRNRTFTLTAYNADYTFLNNTPVTIAIHNESNIGAPGVGLSNSNPLHVFVWNSKLHYYCTSSPSGVCLGYWSKNYSGVSVGWTLLFDNDETYNPNDPCCSVDGTWGVSTINGRGYLTSYDTTLIEICDVDPNGRGTMGYWVGYSVTSDRWICYRGTTFTITWDS